MTDSIKYFIKNRLPDFIRKKLGHRIMATIIVSITLVMSFEIILDLYFGKKDAIKLMETLSLDLAASTYSGIKYPMSVGDSSAVEQVLTDIREKMEGIEVFICDTNQLITWSTHRDKIYTNITNTINNAEPMAALALLLQSGEAPKESFEAEIDGKRHIIIIEPILNEEACFHCHGSSRKIIGGMIVKTNVERALRTVTAAKNRTILTTILALLAIIVISYAMIEKFISRRVQRLAGGVKKVAAGDLDFEIQARSSDEIGDLARSFNIMTHELKEARDEITNWTLTLEDLVEERTAQLKRAQENAIQAEKMASMGRLAAIVAHEINNPLAGIRTYAKLMLKRGAELFPGDAVKYIQYIETIESESARCGEIVRGLLQFARPTKPKIGQHDINTLVEETLRLVQHQIDLLNIEIKLELASESPQISCDDQKIKQALVALLLNACDAVQSDTGFIDISTYLMEEKKRVGIAISDNGIGMDEETRSHMFEPFFTTKTVSPEKESSLNSGLGVSVVYEIVKSHQGSIEVESELGKGTTITICLPQEPPAHSEQA
ncbi:MAG: ATP-binding protein [Desulfobulbaceae bacterium]|nr:ATP-binding protein [Desulfobulbaceae bacterium]